jgi:hypothetical protein
MKPCMLVLACMILAPLARGDTIYTNFGPNQTFQLNVGYVIESDSDGFRGVAVEFTPQADYVDSTLGSFCRLSRRFLRTRCRRRPVCSLLLHPL